MKGKANFRFIILLLTACCVRDGLLVGVSLQMMRKGGKKTKADVLSPNSTKVFLAKIHTGQAPSQITQNELTFIANEFWVSSEPNVCVSHVVKTVVMSNWFAGRYLRYIKEFPYNHLNTNNPNRLNCLIVVYRGMNGQNNVCVITLWQNIQVRLHFCSDHHVNLQMT